MEQIEVVETSSVGVDCLSRCPYCNSPVTDSPIVVKHTENGHLSVAHRPCYQEAEI